MSAAWRDTKHAVSVCPFCGYRIDAAGSPDGKTPSVGDAGVCISCASPLIYEEGLRLRAMTAAEFRDLDAQEKAAIRRYQAAVRSIDRRRMA